MATTVPIFHRGHVAAGREENTVPAFRKAAELAVSRPGAGVEIDFWRTPQDEGVIVFHNATWDAMTPYTGRVDETPFEVGNGYFTNGGNDVPSLHEALPVCAPCWPVLFDIKDPLAWTDTGLRMVEAAMIAAGIEEQTYLFSTSREFLARLKVVAPRIKRAWRCMDSAYSVKDCQEQGYHAVQIKEETLGQTRCDNLQNAGIKVFVQKYSLDTKAELDRAIRLGVDGVLIDAVDWNAWT